MDSLKIDGSEETPFVRLDKENNFFEISGNSYPEDCTAFYLPVIEWMKTYAEVPNENMEFTFSFIYFNSSSYKFIYDILHLLEDIRMNKGVNVKVNWLFKEGDVDIREIGENLVETIKIPFSISSH